MSTQATEPHNVKEALYLWEMSFEGQQSGPATAVYYGLDAIGRDIPWAVEPLQRGTRAERLIGASPGSGGYWRSDRITLIPDADSRSSVCLGAGNDMTLSRARALRALFFEHEGPSRVVLGIYDNLGAAVYALQCVRYPIPLVVEVAQADGNEWYLVARRLT